MDGGPPAAATTAREQMDAQLGVWDSVGDRRAIFLRCYLMMTENVVASAATGRFGDGAWMLALLDHFAGYYFRTVAPPDSPDWSLPPAWAAAHRLATIEGVAACEALLLGINAHINNDLPQALADRLEADGPIPASRLQALHDDFWMINDVIADTMDVVQHDVIDRYDRLVALIDRDARPLMKLVEGEVRHIILGWRAEVWDHALALINLPDPESRSAVRTRIEHGAMLRAHLLVCESDLRRDLIVAPVHDLERLLHHHPAAGCRIAA